MSARKPRFEPGTRSPEDERAYLLRRAADHAGMAGRAQDKAAQAVHLRLQQLYGKRASRIVIVVTD